MPTIALFGGAFNPPHLGHVFAACWALSCGGADEVWVLPSCRHPYGKVMADFERRLQWCRLAFAPLAAVRVCEDERDNPDGRTFDLVSALQARHPGQDFALIGGTDTAADLPRWYRGEELAQRIRVIAVPRRGYDEADPGALPAISSTLVRERLAAGLPVTGLVPSALLPDLADVPPTRPPR